MTLEELLRETQELSDSFFMLKYFYVGGEGGVFGERDFLVHPRTSLLPCHYKVKP